MQLTQVMIYKYNIVDFSQPISLQYLHAESWATALSWAAAHYSRQWAACLQFTGVILLFKSAF